MDPTQYLIVVVAACLLFFMLAHDKLIQPRSLWMGRSRVLAVNQETKQETVQNVTIEPISDFTWSETTPLQLRTFKPKYHMTMGIERMPPSELIQIDKHYLSRIRLRRELLDNQREKVLGALPCAKSTVRILYDWLTLEYLPVRYSTLFRLTEDASRGTRLLNLLTGDYLPTKSPGDSELLLENLGRHIEEDFFILQSSEDTREFVLTAYVGCFPNGFDWSEKFGKTLAQIHVPVPDYKSKLQKSMNRYLARMEPGEFVKRHNWSISSSGELFSIQGTHLYDGQDFSDEEIDFTKACLRCERQVMFRLPGTSAVILSIRTYMYSLKDIREEGNGSSLAAAIDGLESGTSPGMHFYKRAPVWSRSVKEFLLQENKML